MKKLLTKISRTRLTPMLMVVIWGFLTSCSSSYLVLSHEEIEDAYDSYDLAYIPGLKKVVIEENRDLKARAIYFLGLFNKDLRLEDDPEPEMTEAIDDIEGLFYDYYHKTKDFNLKNLILLNLSYSDHLTENEKLTDKYVDLLNEELEDSKHKEVKIYIVRLLLENSEAGHLTLSDDHKSIIWEMAESDDIQFFDSAYHFLRQSTIMTAAEKKEGLEKLLEKSEKNLYKELLIRNLLKELTTS